MRKFTKTEKTEIIILLTCIIALIIFGKIVLARNEKQINSVYHAKIESLPVYMDTSEDYTETTQNATESVILDETSIAETTALVTEAVTECHQLEIEAAKPIETEAETTYKRIETEVVTEVLSECKRLETTAETMPETEVVKDTDVPIKSSSGYLGTFKITGYYAGEGKSGQQSATGMPLVPWGTCAMNCRQIKDLGLHYGDYITVEGIGSLKLIDNGCSYGKVDVFVNNKSEAYSITGYRRVWR